MGPLCSSPSAAPPVPLVLPPLLDAELGRETPQLRHARLGMEVQVCLCSGVHAIFTLLRIAFSHIIHHQYQVMLQKRVSPSFKGKQTNLPL